MKWLVASQPIFTISLTDFKLLKAKVKNNARETLSLFDLYDTDWIAKRQSDYFPDGTVPLGASTGAHK